jgi:hypothetical protein
VATLCITIRIVSRAALRRVQKIPETPVRLEPLSETEVSTTVVTRARATCCVTNFEAKLIYFLRMTQPVTSAARDKIVENITSSIQENVW